jgi:hypothetical protein
MSSTRRVSLSIWKQFLSMKMVEISKENPKLTPKQIHSRANMLWKRQKLK